MELLKITVTEDNFFPLSNRWLFGIGEHAPALALLYVVGGQYEQADDLDTL